MSDRSPTPERARDPRDIARYTAAIVVIAAFIALAALAIAASRSSLSIGAPPAPTSIGGAGSPVPAESALLALVTPPLPPAPMAAGPAPVVAPAAEDPADRLPPPGPPPEPDTGKPCAALSLPAPQEMGGLQNLIRLVPLFGPFSPEAFAMLPAFEPGFEVLGPLFPVFETGLEQAAPVLDPLTVVVQQLGDAGYAAVGPLYAPHRQAVLDAEAQLAAFLQPLVQQLADTPGTECLVALQGVLADLAAP